MWQAITLGWPTTARTASRRCCWGCRAGRLDRRRPAGVRRRRPPTSTACPTPAPARPSTRAPTPPSTPAHRMHLRTVAIADWSAPRACPARPRRARGREPAGADPGRDLDGAVQRRGSPGAGVRQQVRAGHRLLDDLRRCGRRLRADQGRAQDGLAARAVAQRARPRAAASSRRSRRTRSTPPSAELRPGQLDTDSLPDYALLDDILDDYVERDATRSTWWRWASTARSSST